MKLKMIAMALFSLLAWDVQALEIDHCPLPQNIKNIKGIYTAPTVSHKGRWVGTTSLQSATDSFPVDAVMSFQGAVFHTTEQNGVTKGVLSRCMYSNRSGESLDLHYRPEARPDLAVRLLDVSNWKLQPESSTGLKTYICKSKTQGGCVFAVIE